MIVSLGCQPPPIRVRIVGDSMTPTLEDGQEVEVSPHSSGSVASGSVASGSIVVFAPPMGPPMRPTIQISGVAGTERPQDRTGPTGLDAASDPTAHGWSVKRIVASAGQTVRHRRNGTLEVVDRRGVRIGGPIGLMRRHRRRPYPLLLLPGQYFVVGDNRRASFDSRDFGPVDARSIVGTIESSALSNRRHYRIAGTIESPAPTTDDEPPPGER